MGEAINLVNNFKVEKVIFNCGEYNDLANAPDIKEDESGEVVYADEDGNIIVRVGDDGLKTTAISADEIIFGAQSLVTETWTFTLENGSTVTKRVVIG